MKVTEKNQACISLKNGCWHVLTFAETGFSMLSSHCSEMNMDKKTVELFADNINANDKLDTLYPQIQISAIPCRFIRDNDNSEILTKQIEDFLELNQKKIKAKNLVFDFRAGVDKFVVDACKKALKSKYTKHIFEVIIVNCN